MALSPREVKSIALHFLDWIFVLGTVLVAWLFGKLTPNLRPFSAQDLTISFPYQHNPKIPGYLLGIISTIIPGAIICITVFALPIHRRKRLWARFSLLNTSLLGLGLALAAAMLVTDGVKNLVGKPRPDLLSRCQIDSSKIAEASFQIPGATALYTAQVCSSWYNTTPDGIDKAELMDGFRSWVSGHSSLSFAGNTYLTIFLYCHAYQTLTRPTGSSSRIFGGSGNPHPSVPLLLFVTIPLLTAAYVATTRFADFRHHGIDALLGSLLGILMGFLGWAWYGSRGIYSNRILGGFARPIIDNHEYKSDLEAGVPESEKLAPATPAGYYVENNAKAVLVAEREHTGGVSQNEGTLELPRVSLSISAIDDPAHATERKAMHGYAEEHPVTVS